MIEIMLMLLKIVFLLLFCGYAGLSFLVPKTFDRRAILWHSPWIGLMTISLMGVLFSFAKVPMSEAKYLILIFSALIWIYGFLKKKISFDVTRETAIIGILVFIVMTVNLIPMFVNPGFPTVISLGNLDPISYTTVADFFVKNTVHQGRSLIPYKPYLWSVGDLVHSSFRWGSPMILSFFAAVFNVRSYQVFSVLLTALFALGFPLVYLLAGLLSRSKNIYLLALIFITYAMNSTIVYMLYNVFFAQFIFAGIFLSFLILFIAYMLEEKKNDYGLNGYDFLIGLCLSSLSSVYPEGIAFTLIPISVFLLIKTFSRERYFYWTAIVKILLIAIILNPYSFGTAIMWNLTLFFNTTKVTWIGWEKIRYALPHEIMGFYNLYYYKIPPLLVNVIFIPFVVLVWIVGFIKIKAKPVIFSYLSIFAAFYFIYRFIYPNYFTYLKAITYSLFFYSVLFSIGLAALFKLTKNRFLPWIVILVLFMFSLRSFHRSIYQLYYHPRLVDASLVSLDKFNEDKTVDKPFFTSDVILGEYDLWKRLWREYMLSDKDIITLQNISQENLPDKDLKYVLAEKDMLSYGNKRVVFKNIIWESGYYQLGTFEVK